MTLPFVIEPQIPKQEKQSGGVIGNFPGRYEANRVIPEVEVYLENVANITAILDGDFGKSVKTTSNGLSREITRAIFVEDNKGGLNVAWATENWQGVDRVYSSHHREIIKIYKQVVNSGKLITDEQFKGTFLIDKKPEGTTINITTDAVGLCADLVSRLLLLPTIGKPVLAHLNISSNATDYFKLLDIYILNNGQCQVIEKTNPTTPNHLGNINLANKNPEELKTELEKFFYPHK